MKVSELWLNEWVKPELSREDMCERMTMAGLEIESIESVAQPFSQVVVGKVLSVEKHPEADRLNICEVDVGAAKPLTIVCGAKNVRVGIKIPAALEGAALPNNLQITISQIRGVTSHGMLCSSKELGLAEESEGLLVLPEDAPVGKSIWEYLTLADYVIDVSITPNRGDCLSVRGLAREVSALTQSSITTPIISNVKPIINDMLSIAISSPEACPHYVGRVIRNVKADATTPMWMQERLRRSGVRCISPVVDVMNYVMLELGQPMHAFDLSKITGNIKVRMASSSESLELLDGQTVQLTNETLVIADNEKPLAIAGVMGGLDSAVTLLTKDVFLESAYFTPQTIARSGRHFNLGSDSSYRFERGVDPKLQTLAIERATQLLLEMVGGEPGPVTEVIEEIYLPEFAAISLRAVRVEKILGMQIQNQEVESILTRLGFECTPTQEGWSVVVPSTRSDVTLEIDLIEEIMRLYGSDKVPLRDTYSALRMLPTQEDKLPLHIMRNTLRDLGYHEVITYTFVDSKVQDLLNPGKPPKALLNPITSDMSVMRTNLWPGLIKTLTYNLNRQQNRVRLFETGLRFVPQLNDYSQERVIGGLLSGTAFPEQWGVKSRQADFFDLKGDLQNLLRLTLAGDDFTFRVGSHPALHPGQTADIYRGEKYVGTMGALHPSLVQALDLPNSIFLFELLLDELEQAKLPKFSEISKFPEIRRDIAIFVDRSIPVQKIQDTIRNTAGELLKSVNLFDVYQGQNVGENRKSLALSLTLQHGSRTLVDEEVADLIERVIVKLKETFAAELRG
jgi:phenylalanyl-tRNA synthetase beta chain